VSRESFATSWTTAWPGGFRSWKAGVSYTQGFPQGLSTIKRCRQGAPGQMTKTENVVFSRWCRWADRDSLAGAQHPGVYLLAHFEREPLGEARPDSREVIYIGETSRGSLRKRLHHYNRSASSGAAGHSGGRTYHEHFHRIRPQLFVAILPVSDPEATLRAARIRYLERKFIYEHTCKWGNPPKCNTR